VATFSNRMYTHYTLREAICVLCGAFHEQQYVAAGIFDGERHLGDLCPRCLAAGPAECAKQIRERLASSGRPLRVFRPQESLPPEERRRSTAARGVPGPKGCEHMPPTHDELLALADSLNSLKAWSMTLEEMQDGEKTILRQRFSGLLEGDLIRLVDERYQEFLEEEPQVDPSF
jgi:hypothetical protein